MSRRKPRPPRVAEPPPAPAPAPIAPPAPAFALSRRWVVLAVIALLVVHLSLAVRSLTLENPTIDEVIHLPAGIRYWRTGKFALYHHNPPLIKMIAALPVIATANVQLRESPLTQGEYPNEAAFGHEFMEDNAADYFEIFTRARLVMPLFSILGGLVVFAWSARLYGAGGGLLSLALWTFCPNVLAHCRLVTTDLGATSLGVFATFAFWCYLKRPTWWRTVAVGLALGIAELAKFSLVLFYGLWPLLGLIHLLTDRDPRPLGRRLARGIAQAAVMLGISIVVIDAGYGFEGVGMPLGRFEFVSQSLTRPVPQGMWRPVPSDRLLKRAYQFRVNRFRGTLLGRLPAPLPRHYLLGFDEQKLEAEGIPQKFLQDDSSSDEIQSYPVYLDGELRQKSWWYYYLLTLVYKVPEGTWILVVASLAALFGSPRSRAPWFDEFMVLLIPAVVLGVMSVFTNINLGLRYVLPIFPYVFISVGKLVPWSAGFRHNQDRRIGFSAIGVSLAAVVVASLAIAPHYLAYFNWASGGPAHGRTHLIDSNLDWGQDLVGLRRWVREHAEGERIGVAYFGQINPNIFRLRAEGPLNWFLPPSLPSSGDGRDPDPPRRYRGGTEGQQLPPGLYAVSASLVQGLPWRVYDDEVSSFNGDVRIRWAPHSVWTDAFAYFRDLKPIDQVGHSILIYRVSPEDSARLAPYWAAPKKRL